MPWPNPRQLRLTLAIRILYAEPKLSQQPERRARKPKQRQQQQQQVQEQEQQQEEQQQEEEEEEDDVELRRQKPQKVRSSPYHNFVKSHRVLKQVEKDNPGLTRVALQAILAEQWRQMSQEERDRYK